MKNWRGLMVPEREAEHVILRRIVQCADAVTEVQKFPIQRRVMVQVGGNWGHWPSQFAKLFQTVYTFEPDAECFTCLVHNTAAQRNVVRLQAALGYRRELVELWRDHDTSGNQRVEGKGIYPTMRIDDLALEVCDLIYLDVEGREFEAVMGASQTIKRCKPAVVLESATSFKENSDAAIGFMRALKYEEAGGIGKDQVMMPC